MFAGALLLLYRALNGLMVLLPDPRQQDHKLNKDELVTYRYSIVLVEVQSGVALQLAQYFY